MVDRDTKQKNDRTWCFWSNENELFEKSQSIISCSENREAKNDFEGFLLKGVSEDFDWSSLSSFLTQGTFPKFEKESVTNEILISETMADRLGLRIGQSVEAYFQNQSLFTLW